LDPSGTLGDEILFFGPVFQNSGHLFFVTQIQSFSAAPIGSRSISVNITTPTTSYIGNGFNIEIEHPQRSSLFTELSTINLHKSPNRSLFCTYYIATKTFSIFYTP